MRYFIGGYTWDKENHLKRFLEQGIWENGHGIDKFVELFKTIKPGDRFALKSTSTKGKKDAKTSFLRIVKTGVVTDILSDRLLKVVWEDDFEQTDITDFKWYANTLEEITRYDDIKRIFKIDLQKMEIDKIIALLEFKKQIILQGPPGTGKTYMADLVARKMTEPTRKENATEAIEAFFKGFDASSPSTKEKREQYQAILDAFYAKFPKEKTLRTHTRGVCHWNRRKRQLLLVD